MDTNAMSRRNLLTVAGFAVILAGFGLGGYLPYRLQRNAMETQIRQSQTALADAAAQERRLVELDGELTTLRSELQNLERLAPDNRDVGLFLEQLTRELANAGLRETSVRALAPTTLGRSLRLPIEIRGAGTFAQYQDFLRRVETLPRLSTVSHINVESDAAMNGKVSAELTLSIYSAKPQ